MIYIKDFTKGKVVFEALNSDVRLSILQMLLNEDSLTPDDFARRLNVTNGAITAHVKKLEQAGLIKINLKSASRGISKQCQINTNRIIIDMVVAEKASEKCFESEIDIGSYCDFSVSPTCGIVSTKHIIGDVFDEPQIFSYPERSSAALLWFTTGYVEYIVPNGLKYGQKLRELQFMMEIASEAPGCVSYYPSDIKFYLNGTLLGLWTTPGEHNDRRGIFNPDWWFPNLGQYGQQKLLSINNDGCFIDGLKISDMKISQFNIDQTTSLKLKLSSDNNVANRGGLSLFGKEFGDYNNGILVKFIYTDIEPIQE